MNITKLRERIAALQAEREALREAGPNRAEKAVRINAWCHHAAAQGDAMFRDAVAADNPGAPFAPFMPGAPVPLALLLASLLGAEGMAAALARCVDEIPDAGLNTAQRATRIAEIDAELLKHERTEEALIVASEATATPIARRADANPAVVLEVLP